MARARVGRNDGAVSFCARERGEREAQFDLARCCRFAQTWHDVNDPLRDVTLAARNEEEKGFMRGTTGGPEYAARPMNPRIWLSGGGYIGRKGNNIVREMEAYIDLWTSRDGIKWTPVSYVEGDTPETRFSTSEAFFVDSARQYMGKWGHAMIPFHVVEDVPAIISQYGGETKREVRLSVARQMNLVIS